MKVLMISYGRGALYENKAGVLDRHLEYAKHFESLEILYLSKKKLENLNFEKLKITPVFGYSYLICLFKSLFKNFKNYQIVTTQDPFITGILGLFYKKRFGIKLHVQNHSNFIDNYNWIKENKFINNALNFIAKKIVLPSADRLRVVNTFEKQVYINKLNIPEKIIDVAPIAVNQIFTKNISEKEISKFNKKYQIKSNAFKIGWAGRFVKLKRLDYLFELVSSINKDFDLQLILAGDFKNSEFDLENLENKYSIKPNYIGQLVPEELVEFYHSIDVFVLTSEYEGYGLVLKEAITTGCPVLVWNKSKGTSDIVSFSHIANYFSNANDFKIKLSKIIRTKSSRLNENNEPSSQLIIDSIKKTIYV